MIATNRERNRCLMHVLEYLKDPKCEKKPKDCLYAEYRLLSSGTLHHTCLGDWSNDEGSRILLVPPLLLFAVGRPFDDYPLELALQLTVPQMEETERSKVLYTFHPDDEVASDLAALLSLLCRRLITVAGKANQRNAAYRHIVFDQQPVPMPLATSMRRVFWRPHPLGVLTSFDEQLRAVQKIQNYNPPPKPVDAQHLTDLLLGLPKIQNAESIVAGCRLYALALELIHERTDISYQLLISAVETIANGVLGSFQPDDDFKVEYQKPVYELALNLGSDQEAASKLAIEACRPQWWATKKFKKFLMDNVSDSIWTEKDELFHQTLQEWMPKREDFERTLGLIYAARSKTTHEGKPFPVGASYTGGPNLPMRALGMLLRTDSPFPPVVWFERIVNSALCGYWQRVVADIARPVGSVTAEPAASANQ